MAVAIISEFYRCMPGEIGEKCMSDTADLMDFNALVMMPSAEYERLARKREHQRRERKKELYSYHAKRQICSR